jgi:hypothetical protein
MELDDATEDQGVKKTIGLPPLEFTRFHRIEQYNPVTNEEAEDSLKPIESTVSPYFAMMALHRELSVTY